MIWYVFVQDINLVELTVFPKSLVNFYIAITLLKKDKIHKAFFIIIFLQIY